MKKLAITIALSATGALPACAFAQSSVTLYGALDAGFGYTSNQAVQQSRASVGTPAVYRNHSQVGFTSGTWYGDRFGLKGREDLGSGNAAVFQLENGFDIGSGKLGSSGTMFNRQAFVGLSSNRYGTLTMGRQYDPIVDLVEPVGPTPLLTGMGAHPGDIDDFDNSLRINNSVKYTSPTVGGFTAEALYGFGGQAGSVKQKNTYGAGVSYMNGPLNAAVAYFRADNSKSGPADATIGTWDGSSDSVFNSSVNVGFASAQTMQVIGAAATYTIGPATFEINYGNTRYKSGEFSLYSGTAQFNSGGLVFSYAMNTAWTLAAGYNYTRASAVSGADAAQYHQLAAASFYALSKTTSLYGLIGYQHASGETLDALGNVVAATASVGDASNGASSASNSQVVARVGLLHRF